MEFKKLPNGGFEIIVDNICSDKICETGFPDEIKNLDYPGLCPNCVAFIKHKEKWGNTLCNQISYLVDHYNRQYLEFRCNYGYRHYGPHGPTFLGSLDGSASEYNKVPVDEFFQQLGTII